jgi:hypothetical protein
MNCEFCKKVISTKGNLIYHQKNNKSCLLIQQNENFKDIETELINCKFCSKLFSRTNIGKHLTKCKEKPLFELKIEKENEIEKLKIEKENEIEKLKIEKENEIQKLKIEKENEIQKLKKIIKKLKNKYLSLDHDFNQIKVSNLALNDEVKTLKVANSIYSEDHKEIIKMAKEPKTRTNNKITVKNNILFNDKEKVKEIIDSKLNLVDIAGGQKGMAQFAVNNLLKDEDGNPNYFCTDSSRCIFKFQNENGEFEKDIKAAKLTNLLFDSGLKTKARDIGEKTWTNEDGTCDGDKFRTYQTPVYEISTMNSDNSTFRNELACLTIVK